MNMRRQDYNFNDNVSIDSSTSFGLQDDDKGGVSLSGSGSGTDSDNQSTNQSVGPSQRNAACEVERFAGNETRNMRIGKCLFGVLIVVTGVLVSVGAYLYLAGEETANFNQAFDLFAKNAGEATSFHVYSIFEAMEGLSAELTSYSIMTNVTFPFVTMSQFEVNAMHARIHSGIGMIFSVHQVGGGEKADWERYTRLNNDWLEESRKIALQNDPDLDPSVYAGKKLTSFIYEQKDGGALARSPPGLDLYSPVWQQSPPPRHPRLQNYNLHSNEGMIKQYEAMLQARGSVFSEVADLGAIVGSTVLKEDYDVVHNQYTGEEGEGKSTFEHPHALIMTPIYATLDKQESDIVAYLVGLVPFDRYLGDLLPEGIDDITAILRNTCGQSYTYELDGHYAYYVGEGDFHDDSYDYLMESFPFSKSQDPSVEKLEGQCSYSIEIYPTKPFEEEYSSKLPIWFTTLVALIFFLMFIAFFCYDRTVQRRNKKVLGFAAKSTAIVASLFPSNVRDRLLGAKQEKGGVGQLKSFLTSNNSSNRSDYEDGGAADRNSKPIADLFPETTILFSDIAGFTAWSSVREPSAVFQLLETIFAAFDEIAKKRRIFKVETVGDCYVAVAGLPEPRKDHAVAMCKFAHACMNKMNLITHRLEVELGPGTADLAMRMGLHSGPVTAGVLRGDRARFQLFGDTMNTAARMESNSASGRIQLSEDTANLLREAGKSMWLKPREDTVMAKGKGAMKTYWLQSSMSGSSHYSTTSDGSGTGNMQDDASRTSSEQRAYAQKAFELSDDKRERLISWQVEAMFVLLKQIVASRKNGANTSDTVSGVRQRGNTPIDEVVEVIHLPKVVQNVKNTASSIQINDIVVDEMRDYFRTISNMYHQNPFHNFEHAIHVTMSVTKLMSRIVAPSAVDMEDAENVKAKDRAFFLHDNTYGITSDPLTQFACVLSALIHDVDHPGVPNTQLVEEETSLASKYNNKSIAEQNSIDLAWHELMKDKYKNFRSTLCATQTEFIRFRQLVVNSVMATDIMDKDLKELRNGRWEKAFSDTMSTIGLDDDADDNIDRKATIVIEHLIQASDVAHTMQHWHVYRKWNERLFLEMAKAYHEGRSKKHPVDFWYAGEIGFFDFYIIPLAKKLKECGVFGVSSSEYLNYAMNNRSEWERRGEELVAGMMETCEKLFPREKRQRPEQRP